MPATIPEQTLDEVNGPGATEVPDFVATKHELITLVKHWGRVALHNEFFWSIYQVVGSSDTREAGDEG